MGLCISTPRWWDGNDMMWWDFLRAILPPRSRRCQSSFGAWRRVRVTVRVYGIRITGLEESLVLGRNAVNARDFAGIGGVSAE